MSKTLVLEPNNKNIKMSFFKSSGNIQKNEDVPDVSVSNNQFSSAIRNALAVRVRESILLFQVSTGQSKQ